MYYLVIKPSKMATKDIKENIKKSKKMCDAFRMSDHSNNSKGGDKLTYISEKRYAKPVHGDANSKNLNVYWS